MLHSQNVTLFFEGPVKANKLILYVLPMRIFTAFLSHGAEPCSRQGVKVTTYVVCGAPDYASLQCSKKWRTKNLMTSQQEEGYRV
jgi:hypothetical protein